MGAIKEMRRPRSVREIFRERHRVGRIATPFSNLIGKDTF